MANTYLPVSFTSGFLADRTIRVELEEIQAAEAGRKYARKDRRPLDPPPVVLCRVSEILRSISGFETCERELAPETVTLGAICHVDLFIVDEDCRTWQPAPGTLASAPHHIGSSNTTALPSMANMFISQSTDATREVVRAAPSIPVGLMHLLHPPASTPPPTAPQRASTFVHSANTSSLQTFAEASGPSGTPYAPPPFGAQDPDPDILAWLGPYPIQESSRCTDLLAGGMVVQAENVDFDGQRAVVFVFSDLAVRCEGTFVLRYRAGTVYSQGGTPPQSPILAECFSRPFKVYATKEFPGLGPSTKLTKHLWRQGVRVIIRQASGRYSRESVQGSETPDSSGASGAGGGEGDASAPFVPGSTCAVPAHRSGNSTSERNGTRTSGRERLTDTGGSLSRGSGEDGGETWG